MITDDDLSQIAGITLRFNRGHSGLFTDQGKEIFPCNVLLGATPGSLQWIFSLGHWSVQVDEVYRQLQFTRNENREALIKKLMDLNFEGLVLAQGLKHLTKKAITYVPEFFGIHDLAEPIEIQAERPIEGSFGTFADARHYVLEGLAQKEYLELRAQMLNELASN